MKKNLIVFSGLSGVNVNNSAKEVLTEFLRGQDAYDTFVFMNNIEDCIQQYPGIHRERIEADKTEMQNLFANFVIKMSTEGVEA